MRGEEARRQGMAGTKGQRLHLEKKAAREFQAIPAPEANAEILISMQKRLAQSNSKSRNEKFNPHLEESASGFPMEPPRPSQTIEEGLNTQGNKDKRNSSSRSSIWKAYCRYS
ncbi:hypothetical protein Dimus_012656 [Dionaea muscipula]